jgi:hypothetical protein
MTETDAVAAERIALDECRRALLARRDGRRVHYHARHADQLVVTMRNLRDSSASALKAAIASLRRLLQRLPEIVRPHLSRALRYTHDALRVREAMAA